jgi:hypothetical protein
MAIVTKSIGTTGRDYSTVTSWESDLDNGAVYSSGDDAIGEMYNDSDFNESVTFDGGGTVGLNSATVRAATGEGHDGTAGSGVRMLASTGRLWAITGTGLPYHLEHIELDWNGKGVGGTWTSLQMNANTASHVSSFKRLLLHDCRNLSPGHHNYVFRQTLGHADVLNCIVYDISTTKNNCVGIQQTHASTAFDIHNCTVHNVTNSSGGTAYGISWNDISAFTVQNTIATDSDDGDFNGTSSNATEQYNLSSDATAAGTGSLTSKTAANQFVSTTGGSEDLHLKSGADAIDAGTDQGTTPAGVEIDIDGRDRDAEGDTWDIGAHEFVAAPAGTILPHMQHYLG